MNDNVLHITLMALFVCLMGAAVTSHLDPSTPENLCAANRTPTAMTLGGQDVDPTSAPTVEGRCVPKVGWRDLWPSAVAS